uniref:Uncharacterized protein n=1 Tax=Anguilla anguilla TaxID=7936 RepID=A0A0E9XPQ1_ANGAN
MQGVQERFGGNSQGQRSGKTHWALPAKKNT